MGDMEMGDMGDMEMGDMEIGDMGDMEMGDMEIGDMDTPWRRSKMRSTILTPACIIGTSETCSFVLLLYTTKNTMYFSCGTLTNITLIPSRIQ